MLPKVVVEGIWIGCRVLLAVDGAVRKTPVLGSARGQLLDKLFGPEDFTEYASTTAPNRPVGTY